MPEKTAGAGSDQLHQLKRRLDEWRATRAPRARIPEELWAAAVDIAGQQGLCRSAKALRLDYTALKKRMETGSLPAAAPSPTFMELLNPAGPPAADCLIELQSAAGGCMRIQLKITAPEVASLIRAWRE